MPGLLKVVFFADTHLGFDFPLRPRVERRHRGREFFDNFQRVLAYAERTRPDLVVHGGDLFFRSRVPPRIVDMVYEALMKLAELAKKIANLKEDSVVRVKSRGEPDERLRGKLTAPFLRSIFPQSMSVVLAREFYVGE